MSLISREFCGSGVNKDPKGIRKFKHYLEENADAIKACKQATLDAVEKNDPVLMAQATTQAIRLGIVGIKELKQFLPEANVSRTDEVISRLACLWQRNNVANLLKSRTRKATGVLRNPDGYTPSEKDLPICDGFLRHQRFFIK